MYPSFNEADILEDTLQSLSPDILTCLLKDHTRSTPEVQNNIFWATDDYTELGAGYGYHDPILPGLITGERGHVVMPRVKKQKHTQTARSREMAEVFTPSWVCNAQNNLIDEAWFGRSGVFNEEVTLEDGRHTWRTTQGPITFPEGKTWCDYIHSTRLEITCGEAPYIVSRYDTTTGQFIPLPERIGLLDRKLRVVSENVHTSTEWLKAAQSAYRHIYAYEWQGDSLLLAREAMLVSFIEYYLAKFGKMPQAKSIHFMAYIISWNVWQMDGLKGVVPGSCASRVKRSTNLFGDTEEEMEICEGCNGGDIRRHNGTYCLIKDWGDDYPQPRKREKKIRYIDLIKQ